MNKITKNEKVLLKYDNKNSVIKTNSLFDDLIKTNKLSVDKNIVLLTKENANKIENLISKDDNYYPFFPKIFKSFNFNDIQENKDRALFACIREIDRDNSTNAWKYNNKKESFYEIIKYIQNPSNKFWEDLKNGEKNLPNKLLDASENKENSNNKGLKSLASKICKYLSDETSKINKSYKFDCYYINDRIVRGVLLFYLDYYIIEHNNIKTAHKLQNIDYCELFDLLESLNNSAAKKHGNKLTKNELDHILWYCYKSFEIH